MNNFFGPYFEYGECQIVPKYRICDSNFENNNWVHPNYSLVSPGTELWQITQKLKFFPGGYMSIFADNSYTVSPTPHGAAFIIDSTSNLVTHDHLNIFQACVGRFQLIAASTIGFILPLVEERYVTIIGSGPVAIGTALEFMRLRFNVTILTNRPKIVKEWLKNLPITVKDVNHPNLGKLVIDCIGTEETMKLILVNLVEGGIVGLMGSPRVAYNVDLYQLHKKNISLIGLHELNAQYYLHRNDLFKKICSWHSVENFNCKHWFNISKGESFKGLMSSLLQHRLDRPFLLFEW